MTDKESTLKAIYASLEMKQITIEYNKKYEELKKIITDNLTISDLLDTYKLGKNIDVGDLDGDLISIKGERNNSTRLHIDFYSFDYKDVNFLLHTDREDLITQKLTSTLFNKQELLK